MTTLQTLAVGHQGPAVKKLQHALNLMPYVSNVYPAIREDGIFGAATAGAVQQFQHVAGLATDGIVGPRTWTEIENQLGMNLDISAADFAATTRPGNTTTPDAPSSSGARGPLIAMAGALGLWGIYEWLTGRPKKR